MFDVILKLPVKPKQSFLFMDNIMIELNWIELEILVHHNSEHNSMQPLR